MNRLMIAFRGASLLFSAAALLAGLIGLAARAETKQPGQPSPEYGIAARYPHDSGLKNDPNVILFEDYELADVEGLRERGWDWNRGHVGV